MATPPKLAELVRRLKVAALGVAALRASLRAGVPPARTLGKMSRASVIVLARASRSR
jgi:hypothetical protein